MDKFICIKKRLLIADLGDILLLDEIYGDDSYFICNAEGKAIDIIAGSAVREYFISLADWREQQMSSILDG